MTASLRYSNACGFYKHNNIGNNMKDNFDEKYFYGKEKSNYGNYESLNHSRQLSSILSFIKENNVSGKLLDAGCAFGYLLKHASGHFSETYGCDISDFAIEKARAVVPKAHLRVVDIEKSLPYKNNFFDCICALDVLEHTKDIEKPFDALVRKLKKGGYLIISLPIDAWPRRFFGFLDKDKTHISIIDISKLNRILAKHGLKIIKKRYFAPMPVFYKFYGVPAEIEVFMKKR